MFKIERHSNGQGTTLRLSGQIESEHIQQLRTEIEGAPRPHTLDLDEVTLVGRDVVRFLKACETQGIELRNCPLYIQEWIFRESD
jgi:hypothetical protein